MYYLDDEYSVIVDTDNKELVEKLIYSNDEEIVDSKPQFMHLCLLHSVMNKKYESMQCLIDLGAPSCSFDYHGSIFKAIEAKDFKAFKIILGDKDKLDYNIRFHDRCIFKYIIRYGTNDMLNLFIDKNLSFQYGFSRHFNSDMSGLIYNNEFDKIETLIERGSNIKDSKYNFRTIFSRITLMEAECLNKEQFDFFRKYYIAEDLDFFKESSFQTLLDKGEYWIIEMLNDLGISFKFSYGIDVDIERKLFMDKEFKYLDMILGITNSYLYIYDIHNITDKLDIEHIRYYHSKHKNYKRTNDYPLLYLVTKFNDTDVIDEVLSRCKFLKTKKNYIASCLLNCIERDDFETLNKIKEKLNVDDSIYQYGEADSMKVIKYLQNNNIEFSIDMETFIGTADFESIKYVIESNNNFNKEYCLMSLIEYNKIDLIKLILSKHDIDKSDEDYVERCLEYYDVDNDEVDNFKAMLDFLIKEEFKVSDYVQGELDYIEENLLES